MHLFAASYVLARVGVSACVCMRTCAVPSSTRTRADARTMQRQAMHIVTKRRAPQHNDQPPTSDTPNDKNHTKGGASKKMQPCVTACSQSVTGDRQCRLHASGAERNEVTITLQTHHSGQGLVVWHVQHAGVVVVLLCTLNTSPGSL